MPAERLLIVGLTGRALAQSAAAAGLGAVVLDAFGDLDMRAAALAWCRLPHRADWSLAGRPLLQAAVRLAPPPAPLLPGSGFERRPQLLQALALGRELLGTAPATIVRIKDPLWLAAACARAGVPHPPIRRDLPADRQGWLVKQRGGAGGGHVRPARSVHRLRRGDYLQRRVPGRAVSILLLGDGRTTLPLLASEQRHGRGPSGRRRFETVLAPALLPVGSQARLEAAAIAVADRLALDGEGLRGLASADFLLTEDGAFYLLEINPRPGASLEAAEAVLGVPLIGLHVAACRGRLPDLPPVPRCHAVTTILWAPARLVMPAVDRWPAWAGDRTPPGLPVPAGAPLGTVLATAPDATGAATLAAERVAIWLHDLTAGSGGVTAPPEMRPCAAGIATRPRLDEHALE